MIIDIGRFSEYNTPYDFSYCPDNGFWYPDKKLELPEPKAEPKVIENLVFHDVLGSNCDSEEDKKDMLKDFMEYCFGAKNGEDYFYFSITDIPQFPDDPKDLSVAIEHYWFDDVLEFADNIGQGKNACAYIERLGSNKFFAWQKGNNKVRFAVQKYVFNGSYKEDFIFSYDVLVDKTQLVSELRRMTNKYIETIKQCIKEYEVKHNKKFTNQNENLCLAKWLNINYEELKAKRERQWQERISNIKKEKNDKKKTYEAWTAQKYISAAELENYLNELKPKVINKPIKKISIAGNLFDFFEAANLIEIDGKYYSVECCGMDGDGKDIYDYTEEENVHLPQNIENFSAALDEPAIIQIGGDIQFEVDMPEYSLAKIGINTLKEYKYYSSITGYGIWRNISSYYKKNIIGHTIKDIYIEKTSKTSFTGSIERQEEDDMYTGFGFILDNGCKLDISTDGDYMQVSEIKNNTGSQDEEIMQ